MEICEPSKVHEHKWLQHLGLEQPAPTSDTLVPVARAFSVDDPAAGTSKLAARLVDALKAAGIDAEQRPYQIEGAVTFDHYHQDPMWGSPYLSRGQQMVVPTGHMVTRVAVGVHERDLQRATQLAVEFERQLAEEQKQDKMRAQPPRVSDEDLTRQALAALPPEE